MKAYFVSLGCPKNLTDTEVLMGKVASLGYTITTQPAQADVIIVNTCAFLKSARDEAQAVIKELAQWKKKGKCQQLFVAGCLPKLSNNHQLTTNKYIDGIIDSTGLHSYHIPRIKATPPWTAYVKIADGCDNHCAYCLIPTIRGRLKTRPMSDVLNEVKLLVKHGTKEIIYIAQDTTAYPNLPKLLKATARIKGVAWIRLMYAHPAHLTKELIKTIAGEPKIVKYLDLPVQHASSHILRKMNRHYDKKHLLETITSLRTLIPDLCLRTSIIVGFPGETKADFVELQALIAAGHFDRLGVFPYFREAGTPAAKLPGQLSSAIKQSRLQTIMSLQQKISLRKNRTFIGRTLKVLVETPHSGRSYRDAPEIDGKVILHSPKRLVPGTFVRAKIIRATAYDLVGMVQ
ncbi:ribosomal protein S12 methylthiotransferase RimO [candidate division WOR-1 bacterium RIFOXYB2_FULL_48_7]|uniref:Ribosomal protein uS12 methylthiotransferase RimO n=1 Tax=candidate division WOR-1 bacterium RIFOXYB2_FULL_48_7 TaxID=1802583 RepID=A0A1F4TDW3_UNCSA|nr:MAG: ribosomal protein S12 methylthiotransferase RimO [candidate division WOR-1 bacterium RIFOXYB2_FULL_48_7]